MWSCFKLEFLKENLNKRNPLCNLLYFLFTETTTTILINKVSGLIQKTREGKYWGHYTVLLIFPTCLGCISGEEDAS